MNLGQLRQSFRNVKTPAGVRKAFTTCHYEREVPSTKRAGTYVTERSAHPSGPAGRSGWKFVETFNPRRDAIAVVLGIPVSFLTLREIVRSASAPDDAVIDVPVSGGGLRIRWRRPSGWCGGFDLVAQTFAGPHVEIRAAA